MRTAESATTCPAIPTRTGCDSTAGGRSLITARLADYIELTKPKIAVMALVTVIVGFVLASSSDWKAAPLFDALIGIALVAAGSSALNQLLERHTDARMERTANRPLPAGRLQPAEALVFGLLCGIGGCVYLALFTNLLTAALAALTLGLYVAVYTPLKRVTTLATAVGAVPGAMPPVLGWTAGGGGIDICAFLLFAILYLWQFPHFLAICWLYRGQYRRAGLQMLPGGEDHSRGAGFAAVVYALVLLPVSLLPGGFVMASALAGTGYVLAAAVLGAGYAACAFRFLRRPTTASARGLLWASLVYLPLLLAALTWDHFRSMA